MVTMGKKFLLLAGFLLVQAGLSPPSLWPQEAPPQTYIIGDPQGDWGFPSPMSHNPRGPGYLRVSFLFDTLIWKDAHGFVPALARRWEYRPAPPTYTFHLHPSAVWHDGRPLTASDVAFTIDYLKRHPHPWVDVRPIRQVEVAGPHTVRLVLDRPYAPFLEEIAGTMFILPWHIWQDIQDPARFQEPRATVGSGPYKLAEYRREHGLYRFVAFEQYYRGKPVVPELSFVHVGNELLALKGKAVQAAAIPPEAASELKALGFTVASQPHFWCLKLLFNHGRFPMQELAFRRAVARAVDLRDLVSQTVRGHGLPASPGLLPPDSPWYHPPATQYLFDPRASRELLASLGYRPTPEGWERHGQTLDLELLTVPGYARVAEYLKKSLQEIGLRVRLRQVDYTVLDQRVKAQNFDLALSGHGGLGGDPKIINDVVAGPFAAEFLGGYRLPLELARLLTDQLLTLDVAQRRQLVARIQEWLARELPTLPLYFPTQYIAHDGRVPWFFTHGGIAKGIPLYFNKLALLPPGNSLSSP
jgi:peptide/nickel transport system substrate-binding protein